METTKERMTVGNRPDHVILFPIIRKRRRVHTERDASRCAIMVIAPNGMNHGKSRRLKKGAGT